MSTIHEKSAVVSSKLEKKVEQRVALDPFVLYIIYQIIVSIIQIYMNCNLSSKQAVSSMSKLGILERWRLRRIIRHYINDPEMHDYIGSNLFNSLEELGANVTEEEVTKMFEEAKGIRNMFEEIK